MNFSKTKQRVERIRITNPKKGIYFTAIALLFVMLSSNAQSAPEPPLPPETPKTTTSKSYSVSIENDDDEATNSSVSISQSDDAYKFRASYHKSKNEGVKKLLLEKLGKKGLKVSGSTYTWSDNSGGDDVFECKLTNGRLRMYLDLDYASDTFSNKIKILGQDLKYFISGSSKEKEDAKKLARAQRELERAQRDLERAKRDLERSKEN
ncbi:MAG: hypothetical protein ED556_03400 [Winogradskyella sp.]|uniref:hypothetical protein n=1 Tax=Winogradskyella sp. TaxID=1883156 RepID=UPI000F4110D9|nr:hypothetical protein [Winogradskyella sp.]RNC88243.1 MAG: hypothetical protein ED556_03400 [Winogradskyella sp.]